MKAIIDCNSFYCSCERLFRPELKNKPVVVLSNNDGCIISISDEAKKAGVKMGTPYFLAKEIIEQNGVATFSSNYNLYGDMSRRVMDTVRTMLPVGFVEVYSVDEAFLDLSHIAADELNAVAKRIRERVEQWTGISVSIGVATTKTLAKVANRLAKKKKQETGCVMVLDTEEKIADALQRTPVRDIWGVGGRSAIKLEELGITDAWQLKQLREEWARKNLGGVVGVRLINELRGTPTIEMAEQLSTKKMISTSRMFGYNVTRLKDVQEAVATYISNAAEKLRRQNCAAKVVTVYAVHKDDKEQNKHHHGATVSMHFTLPNATCDTSSLIKPAMALVQKLYMKGRQYKKAGVILSGLVPDETIQANLFEKPVTNAHRYLMNTVDNLNISMRDDAVKFAASGVQKDWKMRQELRSPRCTTRWEEMSEVR